MTTDPSVVPSTETTPRPDPRLRTASRPAAALAAYRGLVKLGFPARYPLVQFPNPPLMLALLASVVGWFVSGAAQDYVTAVGIVGMTVWAWQEAVDGVNLFRHLLGIVVLVNTVIGLVNRFG